VACNPELSAWERMTRDTLLYEAKRRQEELLAKEATRMEKLEDPGTDKPDNAQVGD
jgi:hypothetical protein